MVDKAPTQSFINVHHNEENAVGGGRWEVGVGVRRWEVGSRDIIELMRDPNAKHVIREGSRQHPHATLSCVIREVVGGMFYR